MTDQQLFFPTAMRQDKSRIDGKTYYTIWFDYVNENRECYSHIHISCRNYSQWESIIQTLSHSDLFITFETIIWKDQKRGLIDADSVPVIVLSTTKGDIAEELRAHKKVQAELPRRAKKVKPNGQFGKLFDIEQ